MEIVKENLPLKVGYPRDFTFEPRLGDPYKYFFPNGFDSDLDDEGAPKLELTINDDEENNRNGFGNMKDDGEDLPYLCAVFREWPIKKRKGHHKEIKDRIEYEQQQYRLRLRDRDINCANAAVEFYNKKHGTDYVVVETLGSYCEMFNGLLYHCNFRAQRNSVINSENRHSPELFFAELLNKINAQSVKLCVIMDDPVPKVTIFSEVQVTIFFSEAVRYVRSGILSTMIFVGRFRLTLRLCPLSGRPT